MEPHRVTAAEFAKRLGVDEPRTWGDCRKLLRMDRERLMPRTHQPTPTAEAVRMQAASFAPLARKLEKVAAAEAALTPAERRVARERDLPVLSAKLEIRRLGLLAPRPPAPARRQPRAPRSRRVSRSRSLSCGDAHHLGR
jgi:hypothetical protein